MGRSPETNEFMFYLRERVKWLFFPGIDLHARERFHALRPFLASGRDRGARAILDAGCGNGMLSYRCHQLGDSIVGVSIKEREVQNNILLFNGLKGIGRDRMKFLVQNLYRLGQLNQKFDGVICSEVLEHISDDSGVLRAFYDVLNPGGSLFLCCPNAEHPDHSSQDLDHDESGGHVRAGYTYASYESLLEPIGFKVVERAGLGGPVRTFCNRWIIRTEVRWGVIPAIMVFAVLNPFTVFDSSPTVPFSLFVRAIKPELPK